MRKRLIAMLLIANMSLGLIGCGDDSVPEDMFRMIEVDNSGTLTIYDQKLGTDYMYLADTGVVYARVFMCNACNGYVQVISPNGNYYRYDVDTQSVVEITNDTKELDVKKRQIDKDITLISVV